MLQRTFEEAEGYDEMVVLRDIRVESHCEHHMVPIIGKAHVAYLPNSRVVGISKLARVVEAYAKRLQIQEKMTAQIANTLHDVLQPRGVAVVIEAAHQCMTTRGVHKPGVDHGDQPHAGRLPRQSRDPPRIPGDDRSHVRLTPSERLITVWSFRWPERSSTQSKCCAAWWLRHHLAQFQPRPDRLCSGAISRATASSRSWCRARTARRPTCSPPSGPNVTGGVVLSGHTDVVPVEGQPWTPIR